MCGYKSNSAAIQKILFESQNCGYNSRAAVNGAVTVISISTSEKNWPVSTHSVCFSFHFFLRTSDFGCTIDPSNSSWGFLIQFSRPTTSPFYFHLWRIWIIFYITLNSINKVMEFQGIRYWKIMLLRMINTYRRVSINIKWKK